MKSRLSSRSVTIFFVSVFFMMVVIPMVVQAEEFKYDKKPAFSVTYPSDWVDNPDNTKQYNLLFSVKANAGIPVLNVQVREIPAGATIEDAGKLFKKLILDPEQSVDSQLVSTKVTTLKDGTKANETLLKYKYQNWLPLQVAVIAVFKDNKWIRVDIHESAIEDPSWDIVRSLTFKK
jgi:hypothetical protein